MEHLTNEALARLVDEPGDVIERAHLDECDICLRELAEMRRLSAELAALPRLEPHPGSWAALDRRLREAGVIRAPRPTPAWRSGGTLRMAAALLLFLAGGVAGGALRSAPAGQAGDGSELGAVTRLAGGSVAEAQERLRSAEDAYLAALMRYAELTEDGGATDPITRLTALESIVLASHAALLQAPADPVINGYYLTALGERERMIRQLVVDTGDPWF
jgi:hypothetical protein